MTRLIGNKNECFLCDTPIPDATKKDTELVTIIGIDHLVFICTPCRKAMLEDEADA